MGVNFRWLVIFGIDAIFQCFFDIDADYISFVYKKSASK